MPKCRRRKCSFSVVMTFADKCDPDRIAVELIKALGKRDTKGDA